MKYISQIVGNVSRILELCGKDVEAIRTFREKCMHIDTDEQLLNVVLEYIIVNLPDRLTVEEKLNVLATM